MPQASFLARLGLLLAYFSSLNIAYWFYFEPASVGEFYERNWITAPTEHNATLQAVFAAILLSAVAATAGRRPTDLFLVILLMTPVMPMLVLYTDRQVYTEYVAFVAAMYVVIFVIARLPALYSGPGRFDRLRFIEARHLPLLLLAITALFFVLDIIVAGNLANLNFDFQRVYEFRRISEANRGTLLGYYETNLSSLLMGLAAVVAVHRRQYIVVLLLLAAAVFHFGLTSNRGHFFLVIFSLLFYWVFNRKAPFVWIVGGASSVCLAVAAIYQINPDWKFVGDLSVGRVMFIPSYMNFFFYDFFSQSPHTYWSDTRLTLGLVNNPYGGQTGPRVVFDYFYGVDLSADTFYGNANTGFLGSGFGHAGFAGLLIYSIAVGVMLRLANAFADKTNDAIAFGALSYMFVVALLTSSDLPTLFLTHGFLVAAVLTLAIRRNSLDGPRHPARRYPLASGMGEADARRAT